MWRTRPDRTVRDAFRLLAVAGLVAAQVVAAGRCSACDAGGCAACVAPPDAGTAACPLCTAAGGCHPTAGRSFAPGHDAAPCECQWEPRDDEPVVPPSRPSIDLSATVPWPARSPADLRTAAPMPPLTAFTHIPQRPVRILLGVWRN